MEANKQAVHGCHSYEGQYMRSVSKHCFATFIDSCHWFLQVSDLDTGKCFIFRVRALNKAGIGPPSLASDPVVAKSKPGMKLSDGLLCLYMLC